MPPDSASATPAEIEDRTSVLLPLPLAGAYDYRVPPGLDLKPGDFVIVPLGRRELTGVVWGPAGNQVSSEKLKNIIGLLDAPPLPDGLRALIDWVANYTLSAPGAVLRMAMSVPAALEPPRTSTAYMRGQTDRAEGDGQRIRLTPARRRVLAILGEGPPRAAAQLAREAAVTPGVVRGMADAGLLRTVALAETAHLAVPDWRRPGPTLSPAQKDAVAALVAEAEGFSVTLLDGVTGAGKTEVYFEAIATALAAGHQALVLVPEIALTAQWLKRFEQRFGAPPLEWHSELSGAERRRGWRAIAGGAATVVVGARSALFLPFPALGLIVVDEEHDGSFKQEDGVIYHARDMAVVRARLGDFPIVLASATPSLETVTNVEAGRYRRLHLPERHGGATLPEIELIDMRAQTMGRQSWLSPVLQTAISGTLAAGEQVMLFLNRRGYAPLTLCRRCGERLRCPNCTAWLVEHRRRGRLQCHHCGYGIDPPETCPECGARDSMAPCGPGVERLAEEVTARFAEARMEIMASDTIQGPAAAAALVSRMQNAEIDILIGTQIMAKGHHFPLLTMVGVIDADLGLSGGDLRAAERSYQMLHQVSGRAGRARHAGRVLVQSFQPDHPVMRALASGDRDRFLAAEADERRRHGMPPFGRLAALIVSGPDAHRVASTATALGRARPTGDGINVFGPAPAPLAVLRGRHRHRLLLKARRDVNVQAVIRDWLGRVRVPSGVRVAADIDPYSFV